MGFQMWLKNTEEVDLSPSMKVAFGSHFGRQRDLRGGCVGVHSCNHGDHTHIILWCVKYYIVWINNVVTND